MAKVKLTNASVAKLRCPSDKKEIELTDVGGLLSVWISQAQKPIFRYRYRIGKKWARIVAGRFDPDNFGVEEARVLVAHYEALRSAGHDPKTIEADAKQASQGTTVAMVIDHHLDTLKQGTRYNVGKLFKDLRAKHGADTLEEFTPAVAKEFVEANYEHRQGAARTLVRNAVAAFNKALSPHSKLDRPPSYQNPFRNIRKAIKWWGSQPVVNHAKTFEEGEWKALFAAISKAYASGETNKNGLQIIELLLCTGARPSEIGSLRLDELKVVNGQACIEKKEHKLEHRGKDRRIWLMDDALKVVEAAKAENERYRYKGGYLFPQRRARKDQKTAYISKVNGYMDVVAKHCGFSVTPYSLRGAYISFALDTLGFEWLEMVSQNVGHSDPAVTLRHYRKHRDKKLIDAAKKVDEAQAKLRAA